MYVVIAINAAFGFFYPNISWQAHLGGFVIGLACAGVIVAFRGRDGQRLVWAALGGIMLVLVGVTVAKYLSIPEVIRMIDSSSFS
jgi:Rhomboid family